MPTRTPLETVAVGHVLTADDVNSLPRGVIDSVTVVIDQGSITTVTDITSLTITRALSSGRRYRWRYVGEMASTVADGAYEAFLTDASDTVLQRDTGPVLSTATRKLRIEYEESGTGASVTRKVRLRRTTGTGTYTHQASATAPASLVCEDVGPVLS